MTHRGHHDQKGQTETDIAQHSVREAWAIAELLVRLGIDRRNLQLVVKRGLGEFKDGEIKPLEAEIVYALVEIRDHDERAVFSLLAGPIGVSAEKFQRLWAVRMTAVAEGRVAEADLQKQYEATDAYNGRDEIINALLDRGFSVRTDLKDDTNDEATKPN